MKRIVFVILLFCMSFVPLRAQDTITKDMIYRSSVKLLSDPSFKYRGSLFELHDSSISISSNRIEDYYNGDLQIREIQIKNIKHIQTQRKGNFWKVALVSVTSGFIIGSIKGYAEGSSYNWWEGSVTAGQNAVKNGCGFAIVGLGVGCLLYYGLDMRFPIHGSMEKYNQQKKRLNKYTLHAKPP